MITWGNIINALPQFPDAAGEVLGIWGRGDEIICRTGEVADAVADILYDLGWNVDTSETADGYYRVFA